MGSFSHDSQLSNPQRPTPPLSELAPPERSGPTPPATQETQQCGALVFHAETSSGLKKRTFEPVLARSGVITAPAYLPDAIKPPVHEIHETIDEHAELKGAEAAALLSESSPAVAIAYELAKRGWLTIDHAHQIYLGLNFGTAAMDDELRRLVPQRQSTLPSQSAGLGDRLSEQDAHSVIEALLPTELQSLWTEVFRDARVAKYTEDTGSYLYLRPKHTALAKHPISEFSLQVISLEQVEQLPTQGKSAVVIAKVGDEYHARIFDKRGRVLFGDSGSQFIPDQVHELDAMITERLTQPATERGFPASDAEILDGIAASIVLTPITFDDLFRAAKNEPEDSPLRKLAHSALSVARFNARARVADQHLSEPDPGKLLKEEDLATNAPFPGTHSGPILSGLSLRQAFMGLERLAAEVAAEKGLSDFDLVWVSKSAGTLTVGSAGDSGEPESIQAWSTSRHVLRPSLAAMRIDPTKNVMQQVDCLFSPAGEALHSWNDLISNGASDICSMQMSLVRALNQAPLTRLEQELPILRDNVKVLIITPSSLSQKKEATLANVAHSLRKGIGNHDVEFLTYEEALAHQLSAPSPENPSPENKVRSAGLVVLLDPAYGKTGDTLSAQKERNLFIRLALSQQINSAPPTAFPFDTLQQTLIVGSRDRLRGDDPTPSATSVYWHLLASVFDEGMMKNPPTIKFLDETVAHARRHRVGNWINKSSYPDGSPRLSTITKGVRHLIQTADAKPQGVSGYYQHTACDLPQAATISQLRSQHSTQGTVAVIPVAGLGSATEIVPDAELERTREYWKKVLNGLRGVEEYVFPLSRETFIQFFTRAQFPITELEGLRFEAKRELGGYRIGNIHLSEGQFQTELGRLAGTPTEREDTLVRRFLEQDQVALLDAGSDLCNIIVNNYPHGLPSPRDGAGAKPDGRFNENTMSLFGKRVVPMPSPTGTLCFLFPSGVTTDPLARVEGIGDKSTAHGLLYFSHNIDRRTATILGTDSPGGPPLLIDAQPGGVGTAQEIFSAPGNVIIVEKDSGDPLAQIYCAERERQGLPYTLIRAGEPIEPYVAAVLEEAYAKVEPSIPWDDFIRDFPVWDTGIADLVSSKH